MKKRSYTYSSFIKELIEIAFWISLGVLIHDYAHALWQLGGYVEIVSPQGGWIAIVVIIATKIIVKVLKLPRWAKLAEGSGG